MRKTKISLIDDHKLFRKGIVELINRFPGFEVISEANNGQEFIKKLEKYNEPDIVLLDVNMPEMDGYETAAWLRQNKPEIKILALSMYDSESIIIRMIRSGAIGYILKDADPAELQMAFESLMIRGFYLSELVSGTMLNSIHKSDDMDNFIIHMQLNSREIEFIKWAASELTYKEIADKMCLSVRSVEGYREALFVKLKVKSRVGLVLFAIKNQIVIV